MKKLNRCLISLLIVSMVLSGMPAVYGADAVTPTYLAEDGHILADFSQGSEAIWGDGNMVTTDELGNWNNIKPDGTVEENTHTGLLESFETSKRGNKSVVKGGKYLSFENVNYINLWMYVPVKNDSAYSAFCFIGKGNKNIYYKIYHNFQGWKLVSLKKADAILYNAQVTAASWNEIQNIWAYANGDWLASSPVGTKVYIGKMWASVNKPQGDSDVAELVSETHENNKENVTAQENVVSFTLEEDIFDGTSKATLKIEQAAIGETLQIVPASEYTLSYDGAAAIITFNENLKRKRKYKISLSGINTVSGKSFSAEREFTTEGYEQTFSDKSVYAAADFTQLGEVENWTKKDGVRNISDSEAPLNSKYLGNLGKLTTHYDPSIDVADETKPAERYAPYYTQKNFASPQDWTNADAVNLLIYSDSAIPDSRFEIDILTKKDSNSSYFVGLMDGNFEGWRVYTIPISDDWSYYPGKSTGSFADLLSYRDKNASWKHVTGLQLVTASFKVGYPAPSQLYIAHVWTSKKSDENPLTAISIKDGEYDVPVNTTSFEASYSEKLLEISSHIADAVLYKHDGTAFQEVSKPSITVENANIKADFKVDSLEKNTKYRLKIDGLYLSGGKSVSQQIEFVTANTNVYTTKPEIKEDADGNLTAKVNAKNESSQSQDIKLVAYLKDTDGEIVSKTEQKQTITAGGSNSITASFGNVSDLLYYAGASDIFKYSVEAFTVNETDSNKPLLRRIQNTADNSISYADTALSEGSVTVDAQIRDTKVAVSGSTGAAGVRSVTVTVSKEDDTELLLTQIDSAADGSFSAELDISGVITESGWYKVTANALYASTGADSEDEFYYADAALKESIRTGINSAADAAAVNTVITTGQNAAALGLSGGDYTHISNVLCEKKPFETFGDIVNMIESATTTLSELNTKNWIYLAEYISTNKALIINSTDFDASFFALAPEVQNEICSDVSELRPYASFVDFREKLETAIEAYNTPADGGNNQDNNNNNNNYGDTGGGGGGGGGGGTKVSDKTLPSTPVITPTPSEPFSDLDSYEWAKEDILYLYDKGIVSGVSSSSFKPESSVKREEFVKMLVESLGISASGNYSGFFDSSQGAWYEKYLAAAKESGIVQGREDGSFGVGNTITRQDMAVMMLRALDAMNIKAEIVSEAQGFSDSDKISSYANEAVSLMQQSGLINGMGDGSFAPHNNATRAQAAVIIRRILTVLEKGGAK